MAKHNLKPIPVLEPNDIQRFWSKVQIGNPQECWPWIAHHRTKSGYGVICLMPPGGKTNYRSHRVAFHLATGQDPLDLYVCHSCDNRLCCNPAHLWLGTNQDNQVDSVLKGRSRAKLDVEKVRQIRSLHASGATNSELARRFKINHTTVWSVITRTWWKHVT